MKMVYVLIGGLVIISAVLASRSLSGSDTQKESSLPPAIRYLALGDSYTIGEGVNPSDRWPNQLVERLREDGVDIGIVGNPSFTGYTTQDLIDRELPLLSSTKPSFVTILIGVNDYVQGVPEATFQQNFKTILDSTQSVMNKDRIVVVTIPDYSKTPSGARFGDPVEASKTIQKFNSFMLDQAQSRGILAVDIYAISQGVTSDASLTADDGLHPSRKQYTLWTNAIYTALQKQGTF